MRSGGPTVGPGGARARARGGPGLGPGGARAGARGGHGPPGPPLATGLLISNYNIPHLFSNIPCSRSFPFIMPQSRVSNIITLFPTFRNHLSSIFRNHLSPTFRNHLSSIFRNHLSPTFRTHLSPTLHNHLSPFHDHLSPRLQHSINTFL